MGKLTATLCLTLAVLLGSVVKSITDSVDVSLPSNNKLSIYKSKLGKRISDGTYYLSFWMTMAQIEQMKSKKVISQNLD